MTKNHFLLTGAGALAGLALAVSAQQPSPAYYRGGAPAYAQPGYYGSPSAQPVYYAPSDAAPVYYAPTPAAPVYYAPPAPEPVYAAPEEPEDEEGYYWFWGQKWPGLALGPKIGTTGIGLEMTFGINPYVNLRGGFNYGSFTLGQEFGNVDYDAELTMFNVPLMLDIHPFGGQFRLTGGLYVQPGTKAELDATPTGPIQVGSHTYYPDVIGTLTGEIEVDDVVAPYLGLGIGNAVGEDQQLLVTLDLGVIFQSYDVSLDSNGAGMSTASPLFREDLQKEEELLQKDADDWKIYPVVAISISWHF